MTRALAFVVTALAPLSVAAQGAFEPYALDDHDVLVDAPPSPMPVVEGLVPSASVVVTGDELIERGYLTLGEALADMPGIARRATTRGTRFDVRGIPDGLALVVDGVPVGEGGGHDELGVGLGLDLHDVERVEVVRGPVSALGGITALGGLVRVTTKKPGLDGARADLGAGSVGQGIDFADVGAGGSVRLGDVGLSAIVRARGGALQRWRLDDVPRSFVQVGSATVPGARVDEDVVPFGERGLSARLEADVGALRMDLAFVDVDRRVPLSSLSHGLLDAHPDERHTQEARARALYAGSAGVARYRLATWLARRLEEDRLGLYPDGGSFPTGGRVDLHERALLGGAQLRVDVPITADHRVALGTFVEGAQRSAVADARAPRSDQLVRGLVEHEQPSATASGAVEYQGDLGYGWHVTGGGVVRWSTGFPVALAPRAAVSWAPLRWLTWRAAYAEGTRTPEPHDVAVLAQAVVLGRALGAAAGEHLRPEHVRMLESGVQLMPSSSLLAGLDLFGARHEDALAHQIERGLLVPANLPPRHLLGGEAYLDVMPLADLLRVRAAASCAWTVDGDALAQDRVALFTAAELTPYAGVFVGARARASLLAPGDVRGSADLYGSVRFFDDALALRVSLADVLDAFETSPDVTALPGAADVRVPSRGRRVFVSLEGRL